MSQTNNNLIRLNDPLGFFRELASPNFDELRLDYEEEGNWDRQKIIRVFRRLVNATITLNHVTDQVASKVGLTPANYIIKLKKRNEEDGEALDNIRKFVNDVKHSQKDFYEYIYVNKDYLEHEVVDWLAGASKISMYDSAFKSWFYWGKYFAGEKDKI